MMNKKKTVRRLVGDFDETLEDSKLISNHNKKMTIGEALNDKFSAYVESDKYPDDMEKKMKASRAKQKN